MQLKVLAGIPEDQPFGKQWNNLVQQMESPQVFYTYEWALAVSRAYSAPAPLLLAGYRDSSLAGLAALSIDQAHSEASFLAGSTADYCDFVSAPFDREELIALTMRELRARGIRTLRLANLAADSISARALQTAAEAAGYSLYTRPAYFCPQISLESPEQRAQVLQSARRSLKKGKNVAARMGGTSVAHRRSFEEFIAEFPQYATASVARFLATGQTSNLVFQARRGFMIEVAKLLAARDWLTFSTLSVSGRPVAWHCGFQFAGTWFSYLPAFETDLPNLHPGPGAYLLCEILQEAAQDPETRVVDLGLGDEGYKQSHARAGRQTLYVVASCSKARTAAELCRYRAAQLVKRSPRVEALARRGVAAIASSRTSIEQHGLASWMQTGFGRLQKQIFATSEFLFLERTASHISNNADLRQVPLSTKLLATAAMQNEDDAETANYARLSASRLRQGGSEGFALLDAQGSPVHICWVDAFAGFQVPGLDQPLAEPAPNSVLLFDNWTCPSRRDCSAQFAAILAAGALRTGKRPWVCCRDRAHLQAFESAGFRARFSLVKKGKLFIRANSGLEFRDAAIDVNPAA